MESRVWVNRHQPQTLYIAQLLMYFQGGIGLLLFLLGARGLPAYMLIIVVGKLVAAFGIANEMRWAYKFGVVIAALPILLLLRLAVTDDVRWLWGDPVGLLFDIALIALLLHSHSRSCQRYWPKRRNR